MQEYGKACATILIYNIINNNNIITCFINDTTQLYFCLGIIVASLNTYFPAQWKPEYSSVQL